MGDVEALAQQMCANLGGVWAFIRETRKDQYRRNARAALESDLFARLVAAARAEEREAALRGAEVREEWALRWSDGSVSGAMYSADGSDYAEQTVRGLASDEEVVHRTVVITRTEWVTARALLPATESREDLRPREGA